MAGLDRLAHANRWRRRSVTEKSVLAGGMLAMAMALPPLPAAPLILTAMAAVSLLGARVPPGVYLRLMALPLGFLAAGALVMAVELGPSSLVLSAGGLRQGLQVSLRALAALSCLVFLSATTPLTDLLPGLRRLGMPEAVADMTLLTYRFVFVLGETAAAMHAAQAARLGHHGGRRALRALGMLAAQLLPRALDRARQMDMGLAARGYDGHLRVLSPARPLSAGFVVAALGLQAAVLAMGILF